MDQEQKFRLDALIAELETLPTPELIAEGCRLRCSLPLDDAAKKRLRFAFAGGIAAEKCLAYITTLRDVEEARGRFGREIHQLRHDAERLRATKSLEAARPLVLASHLASRQEVMFHFFAVCVGRIERFLDIAARSAGHKLPADDRKLLRTFRALRDYYEHMEDRLPGGSNDDESVDELDREGVWHLRMGFTGDGQERLVLNGVTVDVTLRGLTAVEDVLQRNWDALKGSALDLVREHFESDPSDIPGPGEVCQDLLLTVRKVPDTD